MSRRLAAALSLAALLALPGCGDDDPQREVNEKRVREVVIEFAEASGPEACDLLTGEAVVELYGGTGESADNVSNKEVDGADGKGRQAASRFEGQDVRVETVEVIGDRAAKVKALNPRGDREYNVLVRKPEDDWLIDQITQKAVPRT